jgi:hypothetical protein
MKPLDAPALGGGAGTAEAAPLAPATARVSSYRVKGRRDELRP